MLWTGNNENIWGFADWDWQEPLAGRTWGAGYYFDLLPRHRGRTRPDPAVLARQPVLRHAATGTRTTRRTARMHIWDVWNTDDYTRYRDVPPTVRRRVRLPGAADLRDADAGRIRDDPLAPDSPGMRAPPEGRSTAT